MDGAGKGLKIIVSSCSLGLNPRMGEGGAFSRSGHGRPETLVASAVLGRPLCAVGPVNSGVRVVSLVDLLVMTTRAALRAAFGAVIPGASTHQVWGPGVRGIPASFAPKSLECRWKGDDASPGGGHDSMRGLPEMRTPIVEEQSIPATEDELAKRRAAALRAWLEREMGTERAALTALLAKHGVKVQVRHPTPQSSRLSPDTNSKFDRRTVVFSTPCPLV